MANIGVVDNSAKSALAMQGMVNQARSGNMAQARDYKMYLDKLVQGMEIDAQKKEITRMNQERTKAESEYRAAQRKYDALHGDYLEEKYKNDVESQQYYQQRNHNINAKRRYDKRLEKGGTLNPYERFHYSQIMGALSGVETADPVQEDQWNYGAKSYLADDYGKRAQGLAQAGADQARLAGQKQTMADMYERKAGELAPDPVRDDRNYIPPTAGDADKMRRLEEQAKSVREKQMQAAHSAITYGAQAAQANTMRDDLMLDAVGSEKLLDERIENRKPARVRYADKVSTDFANREILREQGANTGALDSVIAEGEGVTKTRTGQMSSYAANLETLRKAGYPAEKLAPLLDRIVNGTAQSDAGKAISDMLGFYKERMAAGDEKSAEAFLSAAEKIASNAHKGFDSSGTGSGRSGKAPGTQPVNNADYVEQVKNWRNDAESTIATHPYLSRLSGIITHRFPEHETLRPDSIFGGELTLDGAHQGIKQMIQLARDMGLTPRQFQSVLSDMRRYTGAESGAAAKLSEVEGEFGMLPKSLKYLQRQHPDLWRDFTNFVDGLAQAQPGKQSYIREKGWTTQNNANEITKYLWGDTAGWVPNTIKRAGQKTAPGAQAPQPSAQPDAPKPETTYQMLNPLTGKFEQLTPNEIQLNEQGKPTRMKVYGEWVDIENPMFELNKGFVPIPRSVKMVQRNMGRHGFKWAITQTPNAMLGDYLVQGMASGVKVMAKDRNGRFVEYTFIGMNTLGTKMRLRGKDGNVRELSINTQLYFPKGTRTREMNAILAGEKPNYNKRQKTRKNGQAESTLPDSERPRDDRNRR